MIKVKDSESLYRDPKSGAILNANLNEFERFKQQRNDDTVIKHEMNQMKQEMSEIKSLLLSLANKL
jgi:hypothetical protein